MRSKTLLTALACLAGTIVSSAAYGAERRYSITDFDEVRVVGNHNVDIRVGRATTVSASGDTATLDAVSIETQGRTLVIQSIPQALSSWKQASPGAARVVVTLPQLKSIRLEGSGTANAAVIRGPQTTVSLTGSGQINVAAFNSDRAFVRLAGAGRITLAGSAKNLEVNVKGGGDLVAEQLGVSDLKVLSASSGRIAIKALRSADVKQNGSGQVIISGKPACTVENLGTGTVSCGE